MSFQHLKIFTQMKINVNSKINLQVDNKSLAIYNKGKSL